MIKTSKLLTSSKEDHMPKCKLQLILNLSHENAKDNIPDDETICLNSIQFLYLLQELSISEVYREAFVKKSVRTSKRTFSGSSINSKSILLGSTHQYQIIVTNSNILEYSMISMVMMAKVTMSITYVSNIKSKYSIAIKMNSTVKSYQTNI